MNITSYLNLLLKEKEIEYPDFNLSKSNIIGWLSWDEFCSIVESLTNQEKRKLKTKLVQIDFHNADIISFLDYLAQHFVSKIYNENL